MIKLSPRAAEDYRLILDYMHSEGWQGVLTARAAIKAMLDELEKFPRLGREGRQDGTRELIVPATGYIIFYTVADQNSIEVERILHGRQKWSARG